MKAGMNPRDFWESTPRNVIHFIQGYAERYRTAYKLATLQAYYAGGIARSGGKLPSYADMFPELVELESREPDDPAAHLAFWEALAADANALEEKAKSGAPI